MYGAREELLAVTWFFSGLGTFLLGLILGVGGDRFIIRVSLKKRIVQNQKATSHANQVQVGGDVRLPPNGD
jgi:hypothetical protein